MKDERKTKAQLLSELNELRQRVAEFEKVKADHKQIEEKLRASEERFRAFMENNPAALYMKDETGRHIYCNQTLSETFDISPEEFVGTTAYDFFAKDEAERLEAYDQTVRTENTLVEIPSWTDERNGAVRWWREVKFPIAGPSGETLVGGSAIDITDLKQTAGALQESEERYRLLVEASPVSIVAVRNGCFLFVNPAGARMLGFSDPEEMVGVPILDVVAPESQQLVTERIERLEIGKDNPTTDITLIRRDGIRIIVESISVSILIEGIPTAVIIAQDISERKEKEERLQMMKFTIDNATDRIAWIAPDGHFLYANEAGYKDMHITLEDLLSMHVSDIDPNFSPRRWSEHYQELKRTGSMRLETHQVDGEGHTRHIDVYSNYIKFGENEFICSFGRDITDLKRAEEKIVELGRFEHLLSNISTSLIDIPSEKIDHAINNALEQVGRFLRVDRCSLGNLTPDHKEMLVTHVWHRRPISGVQQLYTIAQYPWLLSPFITGRELLWTKSEGLPTGSEADIRLLEASGMQAFAGIPVTIAGELTACLGFSSISEEKHWTPELMQRLSHLSRIFGNALATKHAQESLLESQEDFRNLAGKLLSVQEGERRRLAREMHDDLTQRLAVLAIDVGKLERDLQGTSDPMAQNLQGIKERLVQISTDVHAISRQLHPSILEDLGLVDAVSSECDSFSRREGIAVHFHPENIPRRVPKDLALCLYRVVQEGLRNIAKHAQTEEAHVSLVGREDSLHLSVKDEGIGFDRDQAKKSAGLGLVSIEERVRMIQGDLWIESQPGQGTEIKVRAPLEQG